MVSSGRELYCVYFHTVIHPQLLPILWKISIKNIELNELTDSVRAMLVQFPPHVPTTNPWAFNSDATHLSSWRTQSSLCWKWKHVKKIEEICYNYWEVGKKEMYKLIRTVQLKKCIPVKEWNYTLFNTNFNLSFVRLHLSRKSFLWQN